jgi:uncharacterized protein
MRRTAGWWIFMGLMFLLDLYIFQVVKHLTANATEKTKLWVHGSYWFISISALVVLGLMSMINYDTWPKTMRMYVFAIIIGIFIAKLIAAIFFLLDDLRRLVIFVIGLIAKNSNTELPQSSDTISRSTFLSWMGSIVGTGLFGTLLYGFKNKYNYEVKRVQLSFANLPAAFKGLKIVQISDVHSGSFNDQAAVQAGIDKIMAEKADLILFTGDLVNDRHNEMLDYQQLFAQLKAPMGVFSTLGNHDYGDYVQWESPAEKMDNLNKLKKLQADMGWRLLMNEHVALEKNGEKIALLGIENWSNRRNFSRYGKMKDAHAGTAHYPFKILMSHDPTHWDAEVRTSYGDVDLTLAGHTHGMQWGFEIPGFKFSPVQWVYRQWAGLYEEGNQKLYVNRGFGCIGYPGRFGILPEITVLELS